MKNSFKEKPPMSVDVLFFYDLEFHVGYLLNDDGSDKPRKWKWYSEVWREVIYDTVEFWDHLPEIPSSCIPGLKEKSNDPSSSQD